MLHIVIGMNAIVRDICNKSYTISELVLFFYKKIV